MPFNRLIAVGLILVIIGAVLPFLIVMRAVPSTFLLNFLAFTASILGIFLGVLGVATHVGERRHRGKDDWHDDWRE